MSIKLSNYRCEQIKEIVTNMFAKYNVSCIPINGFEIASRMGIKIIPYFAYPENTQKQLFKKSEDGFCLEKNYGEWYIFYNDKKEYGRINHTIMHEIGHIILDHSEDSELAEKEVKFFAKYALAPPILIHKLKLYNPNDIANAFGISYEAAVYAYSYYEKWMRYGKKYYTEYENRIIRLFQVSG